MEVVFSFITRYWREILEIFVALVSLCLYLLTWLKSKTIKVDDLLVGLLTNLPGYILSAEKSGFSGDDKRKLVFADCVNYLTAKTGQDSTKVIALYGETILNALESILSTPQKHK